MTKVAASLLCLTMLSACSVHEFKPDTNVARTSIAYNLQVEEAQNQDLLLNVWRAKQRRPLYLTDISKITGSTKRDITLGLTLPVGHITGYQDTVSPSATISVNPVFDVNVLNTQDFMRGFLSSVSPATFAFYWRQGWTRELFLNLLVRSITIYDDKQAVLDTIHNYPDPSDPKVVTTNRFGDWVHFLQNLELSDCKATILETLAANDLSSLDSATKAIGAGVVLTKSGISSGKRTNTKGRTTTSPGETGKLTTTQNTDSEQTEIPPGNFYDAAIRFDILASNDKDVVKALQSCRPAQDDTGNDVDSALTAQTSAPQGQSSAPDAVYNTVRSLSRSFPPIPTTPSLAKPMDKEAAVLAVFKVGSDVRIAKLSLRSPEGVLYYLGELARVEEFHDLTPRACINGRLQPIFVAYSSRGATPPTCAPALKVQEGEGQQLYIPKELDPNNKHDFSSGYSSLDIDFPVCSSPAPAPAFQGGKFTFPQTTITPMTTLQCNGGRSMQSLSLLSQLIGLQKAASDFPTTPSVKVIGQ